MADPLSLENFKVLIVEDDADTLDLLTLLLETYGAQVTAVTTIREGLRNAEESAPDIVISNMNLPDGSGKDLLLKLRENPTQTVQTLPVVSVTGVTPLGEKSLHDEMQALGFQAFIAKPIEPEELVQLVKTLVAKKNTIGG
jgi:CheY-like chemotaxis protein